MESPLELSRRQPGPRFGVFAAVAAVAIVACLFAWPLGLACHAAWWLFCSGWGMIG